MKKIVDMDTTQNIVKYTPLISELLPDYVNTITCTEPGCSLIFHNKGQYNFHLTRHHKKEIINQGVTVYHCPAEKCIYHVDRLGGRSCVSMRLIRQHYQKVHLKKDLVCECCGKSFLKANELSRHQSNGSCGQVWQCAECGWKYGSREALMTHGKRKGHKYEIDRNNLAKVKKIGIPRNPKLFTVVETADTTEYTHWNQHTGQELQPLANLDQDQAVTTTTILNEQQTIVEEAIVRPTLNDMVGMNIEVLLCNMETQADNLLVDSTDCQFHRVRIDQEATTQTYPSVLYKRSQSMDKGSQTEVMTVGLADTQTVHGIQTETGGYALSNNSLTKLVCDIETQTDWETNNKVMTSVNMCTQTCDYILKSPTPERIESQAPQLVNTPNADANYDPSNMLGDFLVSTETQTNLELVDSAKFTKPMQRTEAEPSIVNWPINLGNDIATQTSYQQCMFNKFSLVDIETQTTRQDLEVGLDSENSKKQLSTTYNSQLQEINSTYTTMNSEDFLVSTETQTSFSQHLLNTDFLTDMETQTKHQHLPRDMANCLRADDFLVSTETQTSYEQCLMDTELSLTDIETQTNWSYNNEPSQSFNPTSTPNLLNHKAPAKNRSACDDFLVTAETQTTFAQSLLDTTLESTTNSSDGLYNTQYTQTCDELLSELLFGDQENLHSTYTQTV